MGSMNIKAECFDKIIIGAGIYGLYSALFCSRKKQKILVLECEDAPFKRATYINQARVHQGYHYPRSISTALKSAGYFDRFNHDYAFCINKEFTQIYATSGYYSWTDREQFRKFCAAANIPCEELPAENYFNPGMCDGVFKTREYTYDAMILRDYFLKKLAENSEKSIIRYNTRISQIEKHSDEYSIRTTDGEIYNAPFVLNTTYASCNQILELAGFEKFRIKYELCEIILCKVSEKMKALGITVMDGPFFSVMPFGKTDYHTLTSVSFTPHATSYEKLPHFDCQPKRGGSCSPEYLENCCSCPARPVTAFPYMARLAKKYLRGEYELEYKQSLYSIKPILMDSEIDDSRPTIICSSSKDPTFVSVLSGKINTIYDLDEVLSEE